MGVAPTRQHNIDFLAAHVNGQLNGIHDDEGSAENKHQHKPKNDLSYKTAHVGQVLATLESMAFSPVPPSAT